MARDSARPFFCALLVFMCSVGVWTFRNSFPESFGIRGRTFQTSESETFFDALEMAGERALDGKPWPGRRFGAGKICRPLGHPNKSMLDRSHISPHVQGSGIEIGALHSKFPAGISAKVTYVDSRNLDELRSHYPELAGASLVSPDIIAEAETLLPIADASQDFVIASHVLEHTDRVLLSIENQLRVLKRGGVAVIIVPMRCATFDHLRSVTSWEHLLDEYVRPATLLENREEHFREWAISNALRSIPTVPISDYVKSTMASDGGKGYSIHFHVWDQDSFREMLENLQAVQGFSFRVKLFDARGFEALALLEKL